MSRHYRLHAAADDITATLAIFGDKTRLPPETHEFMTEQWSDNARQAGVEKVGFVAEGITGMAVKSNMELSGVSLADFDTLESGLDWARDD